MIDLQDREFISIKLLELTSFWHPPHLEVEHKARRGEDRIRDGEKPCAPCTTTRFRDAAARAQEQNSKRCVCSIGALSPRGIAVRERNLGRQ